MLKHLLYEFMHLVADEQVEIYNEFSLQHELGLFLRTRLPGYKVQFERNTKFFGIKGTVKHDYSKQPYCLHLGLYPMQHIHRPRPHGHDENSPTA